MKVSWKDREVYKRMKKKRQRTDRDLGPCCAQWELPTRRELKHQLSLACRRLQFADTILRARTVCSADEGIASPRARSSEQLRLIPGPFLVRVKAAGSHPLYIGLLGAEEIDLFRSPMCI